MKWKTFDIESSNSKINIQKNYTRVWLWDIYDIETDNHITGYDIESFFDELFKMNSTILYVHNLKFDGSFILNYLLKHGFIIDDSKVHGTISTLITDRLVWYTFTVYYNGRKYVFRDSLKKIIGSLETAAKAFNLEIEKGKIDYTKHRDIGYKATAKEIKYVRTDTEILAKILKYYYDNQMNGITNASDAMKSFKNIISNTAYNYYFPKLPKYLDSFIRLSYKGGYCYLKPEYKEKTLQTVYTYDVKSMYPSVMVNSPLPYGHPVHFSGKYIYDPVMPLYVQEIMVDCELKKGCVPSIQTKSFMNIKLNYLKNTDGKMIKLTLTNIDLSHLLNDYHIYEIVYVQGYKFLSSDKIFEEYVDKYYSLKETSTGALKQLYKIFLNSLYGKFAMMIERSQAYPQLENGVNKFVRTEREEVDPMYTAVASFITSWARDKLLKCIKDNFDNFIYCDTDSVHLLAPIVSDNEGKQLGQWDLENGTYINGEPNTHIYAARYLGQKCYMLRTNKSAVKKDIKKIAGAPDKVKEGISFENFKINLQVSEEEYPKYRMKQVEGGTLLIPTSFTIKAK